MVLRWPLREGFLAYLEMLRREAREKYQFEMMLYAEGALKKAPKVPSLLKADAR